MTFGTREEFEAYCRATAKAVYVGDNLLLCRILGRAFCYVDARDTSIAPWLAMDGFWESWVARAFLRFAGKGAWCIDVGANFGYYSLLFADRVGGTGRVLAIEPHPRLAGDCLPKTFRANGMGQTVSVLQAAVGSKIKPEGQFWVHKYDYGVGRILEPCGDDNFTRISCPHTTIDEIVDGWPRLDYLKVDVEGGELDVWRGMSETLVRFPELTIIMELHMHQRDMVATLFRELKRHEFQIRRIGFGSELPFVTCDDVLADSQSHVALWLQRTL